MALVSPQHRPTITTTSSVDRVLLERSSAYLDSGTEALQAQENIHDVLLATVNLSTSLLYFLGASFSTGSATYDPSRDSDHSPGSLHADQAVDSAGFDSGAAGGAPLSNFSIPVRHPGADKSRIDRT